MTVPHGMQGLSRGWGDYWGDYPNRCVAATDDLPQANLAPLAQLKFAVHLHVSSRHHRFGSAAAGGDTGRLQQRIQRDKFISQFKVDDWQHNDSPMIFGQSACFDPLSTLSTPRGHQ